MLKSKIMAGDLIGILGLTAIGTSYAVYQHNSTTLVDKKEGIKYNPINNEEDYQKILENKKNKKSHILIFHRPSCPDCQASYGKIEKSIKNQSNIYTVNTDTAFGVRLMKTYNVKSVPSATSVAYDGDTEMITTESIYGNDTLNAMIHEKNRH